MRVKEMGATADQATRTHTQALTCMTIIPEQFAEWDVPMPPVTREQALALRRYDRMVRREERRRQDERHDRLVDMLVSLVTALSVGFLLYVYLFFGALWASL